MTMYLNVFVDNKTERFLEEQAKELGRTPEDLASCAISEYCLGLMKKKPFGVKP